MRPERWITPSLVVLALIAASGSRGSSPGDGSLVVRSFALNSYARVFDGQWQGIKFASDGNCYFASSTHAHNHGAGFFRYAPRTKELTLLTEDITRVCGEDPTKTPPQGKIHSDVVELDGWLYFATHLANYWPAAAAAYTGAHVLGYQLATGKFRDYGVVRANYSIYSGLAVDPGRHRLYVFVTPFADAEKKSGGSHLYRIDLRSGQKEDLGLLRRGNNACYYLFVDRRGDCWLTLLTERNEVDNGALYRARAETGKIERFEEALPPRHSWDKDVVTREQQVRCWEWAQPLPDGHRCLFTFYRGGKLWIFDSDKFGTTEAFQPVRHVGPTTLGQALGKDRMFLVQRANHQLGADADDHHLWSVALDPRAEPAVIDHGLIVDQDGRRPWRVQSLATDDAGHVFMVGDWHLVPGDKGTLRHALKNGDNVYEELPRGQFFAVASVAGTSR
jgi:hypothetical protein